MNELKVLVCDDFSERGNKTVEEIGKIRDRLAEANIRIQCRTLFEKELSKELENLFERVAKHLPPDDAGQSSNVDLSDHAGFDCDIVIIDNNLAALDIKGARLTAEAVAGFVRAFTTAPYVVSLNKNPEIDFDLRYLVGDYQTHADLAINARHLSIPALWTGNPRDTEDGFLPWYWPVLSNISRKRREQIEFLETRLESSIVEALDFPRRAVHYLSRHAIGALTPVVNAEDTDAQDRIPLSTIKFIDFFVHSCRSLPAYSDRKILATPAARGDEHSCKVVARVVAAEIDKWFRRDALGPQEVLVDVPHLLMRMPFLLGDKVGDVDRWNDLLTIMEPSCGLDQDVYHEHVASAKFSQDLWVKSPCFWWSELKENEALNDLFFRTSTNWPDVVFCEDVSQFKPFTPRNDDSMPMEFAAEFEGAWSRRHVSSVLGRRYVPNSRFAK